MTVWSLPWTQALSAAPPQTIYETPALWDVAGANTWGDWVTVVPCDASDDCYHLVIHAPSGAAWKLRPRSGRPLGPSRPALDDEHLYWVEDAVSKNPLNTNWVTHVVRVRLTPEALDAFAERVK